MTRFEKLYRKIIIEGNLSVSFSDIQLQVKQIVENYKLGGESGEE